MNENSATDGRDAMMVRFGKRCAVKHRGAADKTLK
jgi:hypothetical protein